MWSEILKLASPLPQAFGFLALGSLTVRCRILGTYARATNRLREGANFYGATLDQWAAEAKGKMLPPFVVQSGQFWHAFRKAPWGGTVHQPCPSTGQLVNTYWYWLFTPSTPAPWNHFPSKPPAQKLSEAPWMRWNPIVWRGGGSLRRNCFTTGQGNWSTSRSRSDDKNFISRHLPPTNLPLSFYHKDISDTRFFFFFSVESNAIFTHTLQTGSFTAQPDQVTAK